MGTMKTFHAIRPMLHQENQGGTIHHQDSFPQTVGDKILRPPFLVTPALQPGKESRLNLHLKKMTILIVVIFISELM
ncbi:MAG TPA: hypothetical protein VNK89_12000 [Thermoflexus sp.]|nr:hypothetical protein [Thermoflexus sp.]